MAGKVGLVLACDGEKAFSANLQAATQAVRQAKSELDGIKKSYADNANSLEALTKKSESYSKVQAELTKKQNAAQEGYNKANKNYNAICKSLEEYEEKIKKASEALSDMKKSGKDGTDAYKQLEAELKKLNTAYANQSIEQSKEAAAMSKWQTSINKVNTEIKTNNKAIENNDKYLAEARKSSDGFATSIDRTGKVVKSTGDDLTGLSKDAKEAGEGLKGAGSDAESFGSTLAKALSANNIKQLGLELMVDLAKRATEALKELVVEGVKTGMEFEAEMSRVSAISGATGDEYDRLEAKAKSLGQTTVYSATEAAEAMEQMSLAGWKTEDIITGIDGVLNLASASGMDIAQASEYVSDNIQAWGESSAYATEMADIMAVAMSNSSMTTSDLGDAYGKVAATAHSLGYEIDDVTAVLMTMANQGRKGSEAGTSLNTIMTRLATNTSECATKLGAYGVKVYDSQGKMRSLSDILQDMSGVWQDLSEEERNTMAKTVAGTRQFNALSMVMKGLSKETEASGRSFKDYKEMLQDTTGASNEMAATMLDNLQGDWTLFKDAMSGLAIEVYDKASPALRGIVQLGSDVINSITNTIKGSKTELDSFIDEVTEKIDGLKSSDGSTTQTVLIAEQDIANLDHYKELILDLNSKEKLNEYQKYQLKTAVQKLSSTIPELAAAFNEETGKIDLSDAAIRNLITDQKEYIRLTAESNARAEMEQKLADAEWAAAAAKAANTTAQKELREATKAYNDETERTGTESNGLYKAYMEATERAEETAKAEAEAAYSLQLVQEESENTEKALEQMHQEAARNKILSEAKAAADAHRAQAKEAKQAAVAYGKLGIDEERAFGSTEKVTEATEKTTDSLAELIRTAKEAAGEFGEKALGSAMDIIAEKMENYADISDASAKSVKEAWDGIVSEVEQSLGSIDPTKAWDDGGFTNTWTLIDNLEGQIAGMQEYSDNLDKLKEHIGKEVSPEFAHYIEEMGLSGAGFLDNIILALESEDGQERVREVCLKYAEAMNVEDTIVSTLAGDKAAYDGELAKLSGSTEEEFDNLSKALTKGVKGADEDVISNLTSLADQAKAVGALIPEGLMEALNSKDGVNATDAENQLANSIIGALEGLAEVVEEQGGTVPDGLIEGIEAGTPEVIDAYNTLISQLGGATDGSETSSAEDTGSAFVDSFIAGLTGNSDKVSEAATTFATSAIEAVSSSVEGATDSGQSVADNFASGITNGKPVAEAAAATMAATSVTSADGQTGAALGVGYNLAAGVAVGIANGQNLAVNAAVNMVANALAAVQRANVIQSPSKKWRDLIGVNLGEGIVKGLEKTKVKNASAAAALVGTALAAAKTKLKGAAQEVSSTWQTILDKELSKSTKKGKKETSGEFGLSWYTTTGTGKNKKTVRKDAETYYGEVFSVASTYFDNISTLYTVSDQEELAYWKKIKKHLKTGTQAWYDAVDKINEVKKRIDEAAEDAAEEAAKRGNSDVASSMLSEFKNLYDVSLKAEVDYWAQMLNNYKAGSDDYIKAENEYLRAQKAYSDKELDIRKTYDDAIEAANQAKEESIKSLARSYADAYDILENFLSETDYDGEGLLHNIQAQALGYQEWDNQLSTLASKGVLSDDLLQELIDKGPQETAAIVALNTLNQEQLREYQAAYDAKMAVANKRAENDAKIQAEYQAATETALDTLNTSLSDLNLGMSTKLQTAANQVAAAQESQVVRIINAISGTKTTTTAQAAPAAAAAAATPAATVVTASTSVTNRNGLALVNALGTSISQSTSNTLKNKIDKILGEATTRSTKLTSKEKSEHHDLYKYLATTYGVKGTNALYKKLAAALNVSTSSTVTDTQKYAILEALKRAGFAKGTKRLDDIFAWMDEEGIGSEMIVRQSDGARLNTNVRKGDMIVPAANTDNLWDWSKIAPTEMLNAIAAQNAITQAYVTDLTRRIDVGGLNSSLRDGYGSGSGSVLSQMAELMSTFLPYLAEKTNISVDGRKLVSATSDYTSADLAYRQRRYRR